MSAARAAPFDLDLSLDHLDMASFQAQITRGTTEGDDKLNAILERLASLHRDLIRWAAQHVQELQAVSTEELESRAVEIGHREQQQAAVKANLRSFLAAVTSASSSLLGLSLPNSPGTDSSSAPSTRASVEIGRDLENLDTPALQGALETSHAEDEAGLEGILHRLHGAFDAVAVGLVSACVGLDESFDRMVRGVADDHHEQAAVIGESASAARGLITGRALGLTPSVELDITAAKRQNLLGFVRAIEDALRSLETTYAATHA